MIRMSRMTDYAVLLLTHFARDPQPRIRSASTLAQKTSLARPTVSKILKSLAQSGLLTAQRGSKGGFMLAREPRAISMADVVRALEGPVSMTECCSDDDNCRLEPTCIVASNWRKINQIVLNSLDRITLEEMAQPMSLMVAPVQRTE